jgi:hypothetical protein
VRPPKRATWPADSVTWSARSCGDASPRTQRWSTRRLVLVDTEAIVRTAHRLGGPTTSDQTPFTPTGGGPDGETDSQWSGSTGTSFLFQFSPKYGSTREYSPSSGLHSNPFARSAAGNPSISTLSTADHGEFPCAYKIEVDHCSE